MAAKKVTREMAHYNDYEYKYEYIEWFEYKALADWLTESESTYVSCTFNQFLKRKNEKRIEWKLARRLDEKQEGLEQVPQIDCGG